MWPANDGIPRSVPAVAPWRAVVLEGDDAGKIAQRFTGDASRYGELVAANMLSKTLGPHEPERRRYRVFSSLQPGERLLVPASWSSAGSSGTVGQVDANVVRLVPFLAQQLLSLFPNLALPEGITWTAIANVLFGWWPYLDKFPGGLPPILPQAGPPTLTQEQRDYVQALVQSAANFLLSGAPPAVAQAIPWASVPWARVPWAEIAAQFPQDQAAFWAFLQRLPRPLSSYAPFGQAPQFAGALGQNETRPQQAAPRPSGQDDPRRQQAAPRSGDLQRQPTARPGVQWSGGLTTITSAPDFAVTDWTSPPYSEISWTEVPWGSFAWEIFKDPALRACATANPGRLKEIWACRQCYEGKGVEVFKKVLCNLDVDPCWCTNMETPPSPPGPGTTTPPPSPVPNWNCTPWPDCLAQPGNWPENVPQPCTPFPACIPQWAKDHNIPLPPSAQPPQEEKKDNTVWWIVGGTAAVVVVVAAVAIAAK